MQSAYLCVIFHIKHKKNHHFSRVLTNFKFLVKSKVVTIFSDVTGLQQRHHP